MNIQFTEISGNTRQFYALLASLGLLLAGGAAAFFYMEHHGHYVTGMNNQIVWGLPHVFAVFMIVAASGALNVASIGTVFGKLPYKPMGRYSALLAMALLLGGLAVLVLDLGRPDRLIVAMTEYNFKSIFAWNIILYNGFLGLTIIYLWLMMEPGLQRFTKAAGIAAFSWRLVLTMGTGSIFGFLVAREAFDSALFAPLFIVMSFSFGLAIFLLTLIVSFHVSGRPLGEKLLARLARLLAVFVAGVFFLVLIYHLTNLYRSGDHDLAAFMLLDGGVFTTLFWVGQVLAGTLLPLIILLTPLASRSRSWLVLACALVIIGGFAQMYVIIIGAQAYPLEIFPGKEVISSTFFDAGINNYTPSLPELALGMGGVAIAGLVTVVGVTLFKLLPGSLADDEVGMATKSDQA